MRIVILYHPISETARSVEEFAHDIQHQQGIICELMSVDSREGDALARLYDIVAYPTIMIIRDNGELLQVWSGERLPLMNEVAAFARI